MPKDMEKRWRLLYVISADGPGTTTMIRDAMVRHFPDWDSGSTVGSMLTTMVKEGLLQSSGIPRSFCATPAGREMLNAQDARDRAIVDGKPDAEASNVVDISKAKKIPKPSPRRDDEEDAEYGEIAVQFLVQLPSMVLRAMADLEDDEYLDEFPNVRGPLRSLVERAQAVRIHLVDNE